MWDSLICLKCGGEWTFEAYKFKKAENADSFICSSCSGLSHRGDGLYCVDDLVRLNPYIFLIPKVCVTVAGWVSEAEYESEEYYFDNIEDADNFIKTFDIPDGKEAKIVT